MTEFISIYVDGVLVDELPILGCLTNYVKVNAILDHLHLMRDEISSVTMIGNSSVLINRR